MDPHQSKKKTQIGKLLPFVAGHLADQRSFTMHYFIVRQRQNKILGKGVPQGERQLSVVIFTRNRVLLKIFEHVVHPPHFPFHAKTQLTDIGRA